jgi:nephrocystin-3
MTTPASTPKSRTVRVFLSSTFRDFAEERDLLVRKIFPELRRNCRERKVELVDVDLRWGITEEEAKQGKVLPICLAEIDRSRPFFMGFIGERYGWTPEFEQYDHSLLVEQSWLEDHRGGKSVTELEMLHGVLNNPEMKNRAFFYFRDAKYSEAKGGAYLSEGPEDKTKLEELKDRIRSSGFPVMEKYPDPEALAERVRDDLWKMIDEAYPEDDVPDALTLERRRHEAYGGSRIGLYLGGKEYFSFLDGAMAAKPFLPVLVTGASGGGKSALLANWSASYAIKHPECLIIRHYLGSGSDAADPVKMVVRLMQEIARFIGEEFKHESDPQKILDALPECLFRANAYAIKNRKDWIILLDGLDKLVSLRDLRWWLPALPPRIRMVVSCLEGDVLLVLKQKMTWTSLEVHPLSVGEQTKFISEFLGKYRKNLKPTQIALLQLHGLIGNPLFLRTLLEELRVFGVHEQLEQRLKLYLKSKEIKQLFEKVLERVEGDAGSKAVRDSLQVIWASRSGLSQDELLQITGLVPATWAPIHNALDESLFDSGGRIQFAHDYMRRAVEERYLDTVAKKKAAHRRVASYFDDLACDEGVDERIVEELPWQQSKAGLKQDLLETLTDEAMFVGLYDRDRYELISYWLHLGLDSYAHYEKRWKEWKAESTDKSELAALAFRLAEFLRQQGSTSQLLSELYSLSETTEWQDEAYQCEVKISFENSKGLYLFNRGDFLGAEKIFRKGIRDLESLVGRHHPDSLDAVNNLAQSLWRQGKNLEAELLYKEVLDERLKLYGQNHQRTLSSFIGYGNVLAELGKAKESMAAQEKALEISKKVNGPEGEETLMIVMNLANTLRNSDQISEALDLYSNALPRIQKLFGKSHPNALSCQANYSLALSLSGRLSEALKHSKASLAERIKLYGEENWQVYISKHNLAGILVESGKLNLAEKLYRDALTGRIRDLGVGHPETLRSLNQLGNLKEKMSDFSGMEKVFEDFLKKLDRRESKDHPLALETINYLAMLKNKHGDRTGALSLMKKRAGFSPQALDALRYNIACYECLSGKTKESKRLIAEHIKLHPELKEQALRDSDFVSIKDFIKTL